MYVPVCAMWSSKGVARVASQVHRLDQDTSGCLLFAKGARVAKSLTAQFKSRVGLRKDYLAIVAGDMSAFGDAPFEVDAPISEHPTDRLRRVCGAAGP